MICKLFFDLYRRDSLYSVFDTDQNRLTYHVGLEDMCSAYRSLIHRKQLREPIGQPGYDVRDTVLVKRMVYGADGFAKDVYDVDMTKGLEKRCCGITEIEIV